MTPTFPNFMAQHGRALVAAGYPIMPIQPGLKMPGVYAQGDWRITAGWQQHCDRATTDYEVDLWSAWPECAIGIACGYIVGIDIDLLDGAWSLKIDALAREMLGDTPLVRIGLPPKRLLVYRAEVPFPKMPKMPVQVLARGAQFVARSIHPDTGQPYTWPEEQPEDCDVSRLPLVTQEQCAAFQVACLEALPPELIPKSILAGGVAAGGAPSDPHGTREAIADAMRYLPNNDMDRDSWVKIGHALKGALGEDGRDIWLEWSRSSRKSGKSGKSNTAERKWDGFRPGSIGAGSIYYLAGERGWNPPAGLILNAATAEAAASGAEHPAAPLLAEIAARRERAQATPGAPALPLPGLGVIDPTMWEGVPVPPREWIVADWVPIGHTTLLYADGGVGKSLLTLQLMVACALGMPWLGVHAMQCRSVGLAAEDEPDELQRRLAGILAHTGARFADLGNMRLMSGVGRSNLLAKIGKDGSISTTDRWDELRGVTLEHGARLIVVDTAATSFAGNENDRSAVTQFVGGVLTGLAQEVGGAVILNAHPSRSGMGEGGSMDGGSTGWKASARSMLSLEVPRDQDKQPVRSERLLTRRKANYAPDGEAIKLHWEGGVLAPCSGSPTMGDVMAQASRGAQAIAHVVAEVGTMYALGEYVSSTLKGQYSLGCVLAGLGRLGGYTKREINNAVLAGLANGALEKFQAGRSHNSGPKLRPKNFHGPAPEGTPIH